MYFGSRETWHWLPAACFPLLLNCAVSVEASILCPEFAEFEVRELVAGADCSADAGASSAANADAQTTTEERIDMSMVFFLLTQHLEPPSPRTSTSGETLSTSGRNSSSSACSILAFTPTIVGLDVCVERLVEERLILLPDALGSELSHPPRNGRIGCV